MRIGIVPGGRSESAILAAALPAAAAACRGPGAVGRSDPHRNHQAPSTTLWGVLTAVTVALGGYTYWIARVRMWMIRDDTLDERDRAIIAAAPAGQAPAMMVALAAWLIYLVETFHTTHLVPSAYLYAMFWTVLLTSVLAALLGVLVGYRRI